MNELVQAPCPVLERDDPEAAYTCSLRTMQEELAALRKVIPCSIEECATVASMRAEVGTLKLAIQQFGSAALSARNIPLEAAQTELAEMRAEIAKLKAELAEDMAEAQDEIAQLKACMVEADGMYERDLAAVTAENTKLRECVAITDRRMPKECPSADCYKVCSCADCKAYWKIRKQVKV